MRGQIGRFARFLWAYKSGQTRLSYPPIFVWLEPTNRCNLKCPLCPTGEGLRRPRGDMPLDLYRTILDKLCQARPLLITLHLAGEPLLCPNIFEMIRLANAAGIQTTLSTNATLLSDSVCRGLIDAGLGSIRLDFCSDKATFEQVRRGAEWQRVYENIVRLLEMKRQMGVDKPVVRIKDVSAGQTGPKKNADRIRELKSLFDGLSVKGYSLLRFHTWAGSFAQQHSKANIGHAGPARFHPCSHLWTSIAISYDGLVVPCCRDLECECVLGDIKTQSVREIWNGEPLQKMRSAMLRQELQAIPLCSHCSRISEPSQLVFYTFGYLFMRADQLVSRTAALLRPGSSARKPKPKSDRSKT